MIYDSHGFELGRHTPDDLYTSGDIPAILALMSEALRLSRADGIGSIPPAWSPGEWLVGEPRTLQSMRGRPVLIRFFTNTCPFCAVTMPVLQEIQTKYEEKGLRVLGFYHRKPRGAARSKESVRALLKEWGVTFPIALDSSWSTLDRWWLKTGKRSATSVTFLIGKSGRIEWIHPGPQIGPGSEDLAALETALEKELG